MQIRLSKTINCGTAVILILFCTAACTKKFKEFNTDPNAVTQNELLADNNYIGGFIRHMQQNIIPVSTYDILFVNAYQRAQNLCADVYSGYMGASNNWNGGNNNTTYGLIPEWYGEAFRLGFVEVMPAWMTIKEAVAAKAPDQYAIAQILKVQAMHRVTDIYGPLPYFNTRTSGLVTAYDPQDSIYYSFFKDLDSSIKMLTSFLSVKPEAKPLSILDLVYQGDYYRWIRFANALKLRLAVRIVYVNPELAKKYAEEAVNNDYGIITENADNAIIRGIAGHPLNIINNDYNDIRMGANMESFLKGYRDPRISVYFQQANLSNGSGYHGIRTGISITDAAQYRTFSRLQMLQNVIWLTCSEVFFLRAEGALRGWNMGGTAQQLYETGMQRSFEQWGLPGAAAYLNGTSLPSVYSDPVFSGNNVTAGINLSTITVKWNDASSFEAKLERIITQKWIAMFPEGQEAWSEFRRTHYPKVFPVRINNSGGAINTDSQIKRMPFPQSEYLTNAPGVQTGIKKLEGADNGGTRLWWDKKP